MFSDISDITRELSPILKRVYRLDSFQIDLKRFNGFIAPQTTAAT